MKNNKQYIDSINKKQTTKTNTSHNFIKIVAP